MSATTPGTTATASSVPARDATHSSTPVVGYALLLAAIGIVLDQATKVLAERVLEGGVFVPWLGDGVGWQLVFNPGAAFGLPAPPWLFLVVTGLVVVIVARALPHTTGLLPASAYGLLLSGALGNLLDRVLRAEDGFLSGEVVDFVAWGSFPRFNLADTWITVGFALLVVALLLEEREADDGPDGPDGEVVTGPDADDEVRIVTDPGTSSR